MSIEGYIQRRRRAIDTNQWLPPGGSLTWGLPNIWEAHMILGLKESLCQRLNLKPESITITAAMKNDYSIPFPKIDIKAPMDWICPGELVNVLGSKNILDPKNQDQEEEIKKAVNRIVSQETEAATYNFQRTVEAWKKWVDRDSKNTA